MRLNKAMLELFGDRGVWRIQEVPEFRAELRALTRIKDLGKRKRAKAALRDARAAFRQIPCSRGRAAFGRAHVYPFGVATCAYTGKGSRLLRELLEVPGVRVHQRGQEEFTVLFSPSAFPTVAPIVKANKRRGRGASRARSVAEA